MGPGRVGLWVGGAWLRWTWTGAWSCIGAAQLSGKSPLAPEPADNSTGLPSHSSPGWKRQLTVWLWATRPPAQPHPDTPTALACVAPSSAAPGNVGAGRAQAGTCMGPDMSTSLLLRTSRPLPPPGWACRVAISSVKSSGGCYLLQGSGMQLLDTGPVQGAQRAGPGRPTQISGSRLGLQEGLSRPALGSALPMPAQVSPPLSLVSRPLFSLL